ncbi:MAG: phosphatase PAP2 family protein [Ferruginibacter sp.]
MKSINKNETCFKNKYLEGAASSVSLLSLAAPASTLLLGFVKKDKGLQRDGWYMAGGLAFTGIVTYSLKHIIDRPRPFEKYNFIVKRDDESGGSSFPSGHTTSAFYTATALSLQYKIWYVTVPAFIYAGSVAWARMYQGVHYPSDVLGGAIIGAGCALLADWVKCKHVKKMEARAASNVVTVNL